MSDMRSCGWVMLLDTREETLRLSAKEPNDCRVKTKSDRHEYTRSVRPSKPLPFKPAGYVTLEGYSSLKRFWSYLDFAERAGRRVTVPRGDDEETCRRRIEGYELRGAGGLLDVDKARLEVDEGMVAHSALVALAAGDSELLKALLSEMYTLRVTFTLGFTKTRDLVLKSDFGFKPLREDVLSVKLVPKRFSKDELRFMLDKACTSEPMKPTLH